MENTSKSKALIAELIGTYALVLSIIMAVSIYVGVATEAGGQLLPNVVVPFIAFVHGFVLFVMIQTLGAVSGGHFNPAVTLGLFSIGKIKGADAAKYVIVQVIGGTLAGVTLALVLNDLGTSVKFGSPSIDPSISLASGIVLEAIFTFLLVWTVVATAVNPDGTKEWAPAAIAASLALGVFLIGSLTGASLNPARAFGPDFTNMLFGDGGFGSVRDFVLAYVVGPIAGGVLAATLYNALYIKKSVPPAPAPSEASPL